jgi:hypothetical protein
MQLTSKGGLVVGAVIVLVAGIAIGMSLNAPMAAQGPAGGTGARYHVIETDGLSMIVTDHQKNTVFFYTVNQGEKPGADLHLRGTVDLSSVGQATIKPTLLNPKK